MNQTITKFSKMGKQIQLRYGSKWEVDQIHGSKSSLWMTVDEIAIISSRNTSYQYILVNLRTVEAVQAKPKTTLNSPLDAEEAVKGNIEPP